MSSRTFRSSFCPRDPALFNILSDGPSAFPFPSPHCNQPKQPLNRHKCVYHGPGRFSNNCSKPSLYAYLHVCTRVSHTRTRAHLAHDYRMYAVPMFITARPACTCARLETRLTARPTTTWSWCCPNRPSTVVPDIMQSVSPRTHSQLVFGQTGIAGEQRGGIK